MTSELSSTIVPSKFLLAIMQFVLAITTVSHVMNVRSSHQYPEFKAGYSGTISYQVTSLLSTAILSSICQGLQLALIIMSFNQFYHKLNLLCRRLSPACALNAAGSLVFAVSDYYVVDGSIFWISWVFFR